MYTRHEASVLKEAFWRTFGKYMAPVPSAEGLKINWVNYKTGVKDVKFFMEASATSCSCGIKLLHSDLVLQELFFKELKILQPMLQTTAGEAWHWDFGVQDEFEKTHSMIFKNLEGVSIFDQNHWPEIISFLKPLMVGLDHFWSEWKYHFESLA